MSGGTCSGAPALPRQNGCFWHRALTENNYQRAGELSYGWEAFTGANLREFLNEDWTSRRPSVETIYQKLVRLSPDLPDTSKANRAMNKLTRLNRKRIQPIVKSLLNDLILCVDAITTDLPLECSCIFLTGSLMTGTFIPGSDLDVTIISTASAEAIRNSMHNCDHVRVATPNPTKNYLFAVKFNSGASLDVAINNGDAVRSTHLLNSYFWELDSARAALIVIKEWGERNELKRGMKGYSYAILLIYTLQNEKIIPRMFERGKQVRFNQTTDLLTLEPFGVKSEIPSASTDISEVLGAFLNQCSQNIQFCSITVQISERNIRQKNNSSNQLDIREPFREVSIMKPITDEQATDFLKQFIATVMKTYLAFVEEKSVNNFSLVCEEDQVTAFYSKYLDQRNQSSGSKKRRGP